MKTKTDKSFTACIEQTARMLRKEATGKMGFKKTGPPPDVSLANKICQVAQLLRQKK